MLNFLGSGNPCITSADGSEVREVIALMKVLATGTRVLDAKEANLDASIMSTEVSESSMLQFCWWIKMLRMNLPVILRYYCVTGEHKRRK